MPGIHLHRHLWHIRVRRDVRTRLRLLYTLLSLLPPLLRWLLRLLNKYRRRRRRLWFLAPSSPSRTTRCFRHSPHRRHSRALRHTCAVASSVRRWRQLIPHLWCRRPLEHLRLALMFSCLYLTTVKTRVITTPGLFLGNLRYRSTSRRRARRHTARTRRTSGLIPISARIPASRGSVNGALTGTTAVRARRRILR